MSGDRVSATGYNFENEFSYTSVKVKDKDTGKISTIQMVNSEVKGNKAKYTVKDGQVYDANGKAVKDNIITLTRYQAEILKAAAGAGENANTTKLNEYDLVGSAFEAKAEKALQNAKSDYHVVEADATENGRINAYVKNKKGETGQLEIKFLNDSAPQNAQGKDEAIWYKPWTWGNYFK